MEEPISDSSEEDEWEFTKPDLKPKQYVRKFSKIFKTSDKVKKLIKMRELAKALNTDEKSTSLSMQDELIMSTIKDLLEINSSNDSMILWVDFNKNRKKLKADSSKLLKKAFL